MKMILPDVIGQENQSQHCPGPSMFIFIVIQTNYQAVALFIPHRHLLLRTCVTWNSVPPKAGRGTYKSITLTETTGRTDPGGLNKSIPPSCKQIPGGLKFTSIKYYLNCIIILQLKMRILPRPDTGTRSAAEFDCYIIHKIN